MDEIEVLAFNYLLRSRSTLTSKKWKYWPHEMMAPRENEGDFKNLFPHFLKDPKKFFNYFRMSLDSFEELLVAIESSINQRGYTNNVEEHFRERKAGSNFEVCN